MRLTDLFRRERPAPVDVDAIAVRAAEAAVERHTAAQREELAALLRAAAPGAPQGMAPGMAPQPNGTGTGTGGKGIYAFDNPWRWAFPQAPGHRPEALVNTDLLRGLADNYDVLRACIAHLQREVTAVPIEVVARDDKDDSDGTAKRIAEAGEWFDQMGGIGGRGRHRAEFEYKLIEDLLVIGAAAVYFYPTRGGGIYEVFEVDSATIRPRVDPFGWPGPGEAVWEQWIMGVRVAGYTRDQLLYQGIYPRSWTPYFASPTEWVLDAAFTHIKYNEWDRTWLTDGWEPDRIFTVPGEMTPDNVLWWNDYLKNKLSGNTQARRGSPVIWPAGASQIMSHSRRDQEFMEGKRMLLQRCCSIFGVHPAAIGYEQGQYAVTQANSMAATSEFGVGVLLEFRRVLFNEFLRRLGYEDLECRNITAEEEEAGDRAGRNSTLVNAGIKTRNEARAEEGLEGMEGGDVLFVPTTQQPLEQALEPPEPPMPPGAGTQPPAGSDAAAADRETATGPAARRIAFSQWEQKALRRVKTSPTAACDYESPALDADERDEIRRSLAQARDAEEVKQVFARARELGLPQFAESHTEWQRRQIADGWRERRLAAEREAATDGA